MNYSPRSSVWRSDKNLDFCHVSLTSHNIHYITPITRRCHANILPGTGGGGGGGINQTEDISFLIISFFIVFNRLTHSLPSGHHTMCSVNRFPFACLVVSSCLNFNWNTVPKRRVFGKFNIIPLALLLKKNFPSRKTSLAVKGLTVV